MSDKPSVNDFAVQDNSFLTAVEDQIEEMNTGGSDDEDIGRDEDVDSADVGEDDDDSGESEEVSSDDDDDGDVRGRRRPGRRG